MHQLTNRNLGAIFTAVAATLHPFYGSAAAYSATGNFAEGLTAPEFLASLCKDTLRQKTHASCG